MNKFVLAALTALGIAAATQQSASAAGGPLRLGINIGCLNYGITVGFSGGCNSCAPCNPCGGGGCGGGGGGAAGPWYTYYPYPAYFQAPVPMGGYPYWPTQGMGYASQGH